MNPSDYQAIHESIEQRRERRRANGDSLEPIGFLTFCDCCLEPIDSSNRSVSYGVCSPCALEIVEEVENERRLMKFLVCVIIVVLAAVGVASAINWIAWNAGQVNTKDENK